MKIFISWAGNRSKAVAEILSDWIKCVLQATKPWISTRDIDRGALWFSEIHDQLKDTSVGIVCLTMENKNRPWILFETGALAKGLTSTRVCTFLVDLKPSDLEDPLAQFNHTFPHKESVWELIRTLNNCLSLNGLDERILVQVFETYWPQFENKYKEAMESNPISEKPEKRSDKTLLAEILENTRYLDNRIRSLEIGLKRELNCRSSAHDNYNISGNSAKELIRDLINEGVGRNELVAKMLHLGVPSNFINQQIKEFENNISSE